MSASNRTDRISMCMQHIMSTGCTSISSSNTKVEVQALGTNKKLGKTMLFHAIQVYAKKGLWHKLSRRDIHTL
ncbi:hypothetical protein Glove_519g15 [Diversispora epigaea]|uniref:Uncharacterized protein n=1 Tax=Diversispora epigaea TaxID=1348612 RepID=A0A397GHE5_9GLOM|nr:hypothetical protein Glove_519g15 [Diversispora epigaea]